jgi:chaperonin GroES
MAEVLAVGPGAKDVEMVLKVGDKVVYQKYAGTEVKVDGQELIVIKQSDVLAIVE